MSLEDQLKTLKPVLKKIAAGGGEITGSFYFIRSGNKVHLAATLARRDPSGKKVVKTTSALTSKDPEFKGGKFVHGKIYTDPENTGKRLIFHLNALKGAGARGALKASKLREGLKLFTKQHSGFSFLTTVLMREGKEDVVEEEDGSQQASSQEIEADLELSPDEQAAIDEIRADEKALSAANENLEALLIVLEEDQQAEVQNLLADILQLSKGSDKEALAKARENLAKLLAPGETFPGVGEAVSPEIQALMSSANDATIQMLEIEIQEFQNTVNAIHDEVSGIGEDNQEALQNIAPERLSTLTNCEDAIARIKDQLNSLA